MIDQVPDHMAARHEWHRPDYALLAAVAVLLVIGLDMVYSASYVIAHNNPAYGSDTYFLVRQLIWAGMGAIGLLIFQIIDYHRWQRLTVPLMAVIVILLFIVLVSRLGHSAYGAQRWLQIGPLPPLQPSEFAKFALVLYYAEWLSRRRDRITSFSEVTLPFGVTVAVVCGLVVMQPDLGSAFVIATTAVCLFFVAGADVRHLIGGLVVGTGAMVLLILDASYRSQRITAFLNPASDPLGVGWNITQAEIALGSGGIFGLGLGASRQKFYYLPNAHTDAIFAVIGEELGLLGTAAILILFAVIAYRGYRIAIQAPDSYGALLASGITSWLVVQALINVAVITAVIPFTGIPLPFVSFGGSSLIVSLVAVGVLLNVSRQPAGFRPDRRRNHGAEPFVWGAE
ncbi:MAG TPA: putative lipid II flippase FtsW [Chloroflexota bacterium]|nr:putative lipid II flippase FtsW [Chloroflexota bacterium]